MPIREPVSEQLLEQMKKVFGITFRDYKEHMCQSTIALLIVHLYELALVAFTLHYSSGVATYSVVKLKLPYLQGNQEFVKMRDDVVHNLYHIGDFKKRLNEFLMLFSRENFEVICRECDIDFSLYDELLSYCNSFIFS